MQMKKQTGLKRVLGEINLWLRVITCLPIILVMVLVVPILAQAEMERDSYP
jgi:hypothetical protein